MKIQLKQTGDHITKKNGQKNVKTVKIHFTSDNDDESYNENNEQQQLPKGIVNNCYKQFHQIFLQKLINDFAVCKLCSRTLLLVEDVSHGFGKGIAKPCTHLHPPLPSSFQSPPSSLEYPQHYQNQNIACNWSISPNLSQKIQIVRFD